MRIEWTDLEIRWVGRSWAAMAAGCSCVVVVWCYLSLVVVRNGSGVNLKLHVGLIRGRKLPVWDKGEVVGRTSFERLRKQGGGVNHSVSCRCR